MWESIQSIPWPNLSPQTLLDNWQAIVASLQDPRRLDACMSMLPPACAIIGLLLLMLHILGAGQSRGLRWACILVYLLGASSAAIATYHTHPAMLALVSQSVNLDQPPLRDLIHQHQWVMKYLWLGLTTPAFFLLLSSFKTWIIRWPCLLLSLLLALTILTWTGLAMTQQQELLFGHGLGTPRTPYNLTPTPSSSTNN